MTIPNHLDPLVTVYIPTYNRLKLLQRAIESVLNQTYKNIEIIIVDDCSKDGTYQYLKELASKNSKIHFFIKKTNSGACVSRNIAIEKANGYFITGLDDDDYFHPNRIETFVNEARKNDKRAYFSSYNIKVSDSIIRQPSILTILKRNKISNHNLLLRRNFIGNQIFVKTEYLRNSGGFDPHLKAWQDLECWYNLLKTQEIEAIFIKKPTQTIDISHEHERISTQKISKIFDSYDYFIKKHNLNYLQRFILENQLIRYRPDDYHIPKKILLFLITRNRHLLQNLISRN